MNTVWKKALAVLLCAMMLFTVVSGCAPSEEEPDDGKSTSSTSSTTGNGDATDVTDPSGDVTDPSGDVTDPSGDATDVTGDVTDATGDVTDPSGSTTGTTVNNPNGNNKPTKTNNKTTASTKTTVSTKNDGNETTIKVGNLTVHSKSEPYVTGGTMNLEVWIPWSSETASMDKQAIKSVYEKKSGIKANYNIYRYSDIFVLKSTMLNSGKIPDVFVAVAVGFPAHEVAKYGKQGFFADLTDKLQTWTPNLVQKFNSGNYDQAKLETYANKTVYSLPQLNKARDDATRNHIDEVQPMINTAWLEELELEVPTTMDEFYEVCKAFTKRDPDGNGKNDTFGFGSALIYPQMWNPWGLAMSWYSHGTITEKGEVLSGPLTDNFREGCRFYNRMWEEGLMCKSMFGSNGGATDGAALKALIAKTGIVATSRLLNNVSDSELKNWKVISWPKASNTGDFKAGITGGRYSDGWANSFMISAKTASVEACLRWLDYFYSNDGAMMWTYGPAGVAYKKVGNNYKLMKNATKLASNQRMLSDVCPLQPCNILANNAGEQTAREQQEARLQKEARSVNTYAKYAFYQLDSFVTEADQAKLSKLKWPGDWNWGAEAIRGVVDIETDWNSYKTQYSADYAEWKKIYQAIFDKHYK